MLFSGLATVCKAPSSSIGKVMQSALHLNPVNLVAGLVRFWERFGVEELRVKGLGSG